MWAAWRGDSESVAILLDHGADPQATSFNGNSVLIYAAYGGSIDCMSLILGTGADINHTSNSLLTPAMGGSKLGDNLAIAKVCLTSGAAIEASRRQKFTPLYVAALTNRVESVAFLLERGASTEWSEWNCSDPLSLAVSSSNHRMADALIQHGANLNVAPAFTLSYLRNVAVFGDEKILRLFIDARPAIEVNLRDPQGCTASDRMQERLSSMGPSDPRKEGLAATFQELVAVCSGEYDKTESARNYAVVEEVIEDHEKVDKFSSNQDQDNADDVFYDALEKQEEQETQQDPSPRSSSPVYGVQTADWALHRSPIAGVPDMSTGWTMKRSPTAKYQDSVQKGSGRSSGHWYLPSSYSRFRRSSFPAAIQEVL